MDAAQVIEGELTFDTVPELYRVSAPWFEGSGALTLDLAKVTKTDSAGLALLIEWQRRAQAAKRALHFANIPEQVQTLIRINGLQDSLLRSTI